MREECGNLTKNTYAATQRKAEVFSKQRDGELTIEN